MARAEQPRRRGIPPLPRPRDEFSVVQIVDGPLGVALWQALRNVVIWARTPPTSREGLFQPLAPHVRERYDVARAHAPDLRGALDALQRMQEAPAALEPGVVAAACHRVYEWLDLRALIAPATHFAEAAAYADPGCATWAVDAGWICRKAGGAEMLDRSGAWYRRARALAVRTRDREEVLRALTGYGALAKDEGKLDKARALYDHAARRAVRTGRRRRAATAYHYLFSLEAEFGTMEGAVRYADLALNHYPLNDERLPALAHDVGYMLVRARCYRAAVRLVERAAGCVRQPHELGLVFATLAQAAGGARRPEKYDAAERAALNLVALHDELAPAALESLAEGARSLGDWERAGRHARESLALARERGDVTVERSVSRLIAAVERREAGSPPAALSPDSPAARLARRLAARMRVWRRPRPRRQRIELDFYL